MKISSTLFSIKRTCSVGLSCLSWLGLPTESQISLDSCLCNNYLYFVISWPILCIKLALQIVILIWVEIIIFQRATCINPYASSSSYQMFSNYPECANIPSGCQRCDDVCSNRDGHDKYSYTRFGPEAPAKTGGPLINLPVPPAPPVDFEKDCSKINGRMICCDIEGECSGYTGPHFIDVGCYFDNGGEVCFWVLNSCNIPGHS